MSSLCPTERYFYCPQFCEASSALTTKNDKWKFCSHRSNCHYDTPQCKYWSWRHDNSLLKLILYPLLRHNRSDIIIRESKVHGANMGPTWVLTAPDGPHFGPMNLAIRDMTPTMPLMWLQPDIPNQAQDESCTVWIMCTVLGCAACVANWTFIWYHGKYDMGICGTVALVAWQVLVLGCLQAMWPVCIMYIYTDTWGFHGQAIGCVLWVCWGKFEVF